MAEALHNFFLFISNQTNRKEKSIKLRKIGKGLLVKQTLSLSFCSRVNWQKSLLERNLTVYQLGYIPQ